MADKPKLTAVGTGDIPPARPRSRSSIGFPYSDLAEVERAAHLVAGSLGRCKPEQLAAWLGHTTLDSGAFRNKVVAGKLFRILQGGRNVIELTRLGQQLLEEVTVRQARVEAFLSVALYRSIFESHRGKRMPGNLGLELEMVRLGVSRTQVKPARQVFVRSAGQAGLFEAGSHRLVLPKGTIFPVPSVEERGEGPHAASRAAGYPKVIAAILEQAPWNSEWSQEEFEAWAGLLVQAARLHFKASPESGRS